MSDVTNTLDERLLDRAAEAAERLTLAASAAGLADVAYVEHDSAIGPLLLARTENGLARIAFADVEDTDEVLETLSERLSPRVVRAPQRLDRERRELDEYLAGNRQVFDVPLDWTLVRAPFMRAVLDRCAAIPYGELRTYSEMASEAGNPRAYRAAGTALARNPIPLIVPCHRVVGTSGSLTGYGGKLWRKRKLLVLEGSLLA